MALGILYYDPHIPHILSASRQQGVAQSALQHMRRHLWQRLLNDGHLKKDPDSISHTLQSIMKVRGWQGGAGEEDSANDKGLASVQTACLVLHQGHGRCFEFTVVVPLK